MFCDFAKKKKRVKAVPDLNLAITKPFISNNSCNKILSFHRDTKHLVSTLPFPQ